MDAAERDHLVLTELCRPLLSGDNRAESPEAIGQHFGVATSRIEALLNDLSAKHGIMPNERADPDPSAARSNSARYNDLARYAIEAGLVTPGSGDPPQIETTTRDSPSDRRGDGGGSARGGDTIEPRGVV